MATRNTKRVNELHDVHFYIQGLFDTFTNIDVMVNNKRNRNSKLLIKSLILKIK